MAKPSLPERVKAQSRIRAAKPTQTDLVRAFGEEGLRVGKKGWRYHFKKRDGSVDMKKLREFKEMMRPADRLETALADSTAKPEVKAERQRGPAVSVPAMPWTSGYKRQREAGLV